ncbi:SAM-dependent methyltransferase [Actinokineospora baliensis]|uniref:methyltransferase domain-containing protein n=1 Tax=Actinokineospora baliensis TaxID=547056 RepID=UPI00195E760E|nr:methyltransferase domain-containing protein [Actinokineospora baliensis]MBM7775051.1 SAM-dependent methyltransferase [Actinokineospora baliensis]
MTTPSAPSATGTTRPGDTRAGERGHHAVDLLGAVVAALGDPGDGPTVVIGADPGILTALRARGAVVAVGADLLAEVHALPLHSGSAAAVVALHALPEVEDVDAALAEFARVVGPGGRVVISANALAHRRELRGLWTTAARDCGVVDPPAFLDGDERFSLDHAEAWLRRHLTDVSLTPVRGTTTLDTARALALLRDQRPEGAGVTWDLLASVVESRVRDAVAEHGGFTLSTLTGVATGTVAAGESAK